MKKYRVSFNYEESGTCIVEARSAGEAEFILHDRLLMDGTDGLDFDANAREIYTNGAEDVTGVGGISLSIANGDHIPEEEYDEPVPWDMKVYLFDVDNDPTTPYHEESITVMAIGVEDAKTEAKREAHELKETVGVNVSVEVEEE